MSNNGDARRARDKRVLVTGASGFVGRHALPELVAREYAVHAVARRRDAPEIPGVVWHRADLFDKSARESLLDDVAPTHLLHLAWCASPGEFWESADNLTWLSTTVALVERFISAGGRRLVIAGTCAEYDWRYGYCVEDLTPLAPTTMYGAAKQATCLITRQLAAQHGVSWGWGRLFFLFGPYEHPARLVPTVIRGIIERNAVACSHGTQMRDFLHVADAASALAALLDSGVTGPVNIGSGRPVAIRDLVESIAGRLGRPDLVSFGAIDRREPAAVLASVDRLHEAVRWAPRYSLEEALTDTIRWWLQQLPQALDDERRIQLSRL